jgi:trimeric autotransporter adhesin
MFRTRVCVGICLLLVGCLLPVLAQQPAAAGNAIVPPMVKVSGTLTDTNGKPLTEVVGVTFFLYKDSQGGVPLWMETQNLQPDKTGHYTVMLGSGSSQGLTPDLFVSGEARWLGVQAQGQAEQPRTVLLSVPYALKAADAETIGGFPPSAFVLAVPTSRGAAADLTNGNLATPSGSSQAPPASNVTTTGGTVNALPLWTTKTNIQSSAITQSGSGKTAKVGINTAKPASALDVNGTGTVRGNLSLPATGAATTQAGKTSQPTTFTASAYNSNAGAAVPQNFRWQAEPVGNDTANASGSLNLLFGAGSNPINETGLNIASNGLITFASGQSFPGAGTVTSVGLSAPASDFTVSNSPITQSGTLGLSWTVSPTSTNTANAIVKRDGTGSFSAQNISAVTLSAANPAGTAIVGSTAAPAGAVVGTNAGDSAVADGVDGVTSSASASGVAGINNSGGIGIYGAGGTGVYGTGPISGVEGQGNAPYSNAGYFLGWSAPAGSGYYGSLGIETFGGNGDPNSGSAGGTGIYGQGGGGTNGDGYGGYFIGGSQSLYGHGIVANGGSGYAGYFNGDVNVTGNLAKGGGSFKIDHPLDPANKYLYHSFVESPDMMNIYNGTVALDANGEAVIPMPEWFGVLNRDFRYQLTCIGGFAPIYVAEELANNQFKIGGGRAGLKVSWQVTGIRQDAWANSHRIPVEEEKDAHERGFYIHPELYGAPAEKQIEWAHHPEMMKRMKERPVPQHPAIKPIAQQQIIRASK